MANWEGALGMIFIVLRAEIRPEKREDWLAAIEKYTADVRAEPGNISFDYYENAQVPNQFVIVENFADADAGSAHVATTHAKEFFEFLPAVITETPKINYQDLDGEGWSEMAEVKPA